MEMGFSLAVSDRPDVTKKLAQFFVILDFKSKSYETPFSICIHFRFIILCCLFFWRTGEKGS